MEWSIYRPGLDRWPLTKVNMGPPEGGAHKEGSVG